MHTFEMTSENSFFEGFIPYDTYSHSFPYSNIITSLGSLYGIENCN